jgi:hypothetical protein
MKEKEFWLDFCEECFQMTNHVDDECQKCKAKEKKTSRYDDEEFLNKNRKRNESKNKT